MDPYVYSFRFCCDPDFNDQRELESLDRFVEEAAVDDVAGARLLLVDDVATTGASLAEGTRALLDRGASSVTACVLARVW